jgi:hypothetical protein
VQDAEQKLANARNAKSSAQTNQDEAAKTVKDVRAKLNQLIKVVDGSIDTPKAPDQPEAPLQPTALQRRYYAQNPSQLQMGVVFGRLKPGYGLRTTSDRTLTVEDSYRTRTDLITLLKLRKENGTKMCEDSKCNKLGDVRAQGGKCFVTEQKSFGRLQCTEVDVPLAPCSIDKNKGIISITDFKIEEQEGYKRGTDCVSYTIPPERRIETAKKVVDFSIQVYLEACKDNPSQNQKRVRGRKRSHDPNRHGSFHSFICPGLLSSSDRAKQIEFLGAQVLRGFNNESIRLLTVRLREINQSLREQVTTRLGNGDTQTALFIQHHNIGPQGVNGESVVNALNCIDPKYFGPNLSRQTSCFDDTVHETN